MKHLNIAPFLLAFTVATAPFSSFVGHAVVHLVMSEHEHAHDTAKQTHHHPHEAEHHVLNLTPLSLAIAAASIKIHPVFKIAASLTPDLSSEKIKRKPHTGFLEEAPPPRLEPFISLLLHPTNAPPLR